MSATVRIVFRAFTSTSQRWLRRDGLPESAHDLASAAQTRLGCIGIRVPVWYLSLVPELCGFTVTVAHYKWNPIEHRVFSEISKNCAAEPTGQL